MVELAAPGWDDRGVRCPLISIQEVRMPVLPASLDLAKFLARDVEKSFWNGQGSFRILSKDFVSALDKDPRVTLGALRLRLRDAGKPLVVPLGLDFSIAASDPIRLGTKNGGSGTR